MTQTRPELHKRQRRGIGGEEELPVEEAVAEWSGLYGMLGYRSLSHLSLITQQWLTVRQFEL